QAKLAAAHIRILVKRGEFLPARRLADSLVPAWSANDVSGDAAGALSGVAALTGRIEWSARWAAASSASDMASMGVAGALATAASRFTARAAPGVCDDSLRVLRVDFERVLDSYSTPNRRDQLRRAALWQGAPLAFPCLRGDAI